jgi:uncharacterized protein (TIGR03437 family)
MLLISVVASPLFSQKPTINLNGIVNAASLGPITGGVSFNPVALGSIVTIFGSNLASETKSADTVPLPTVLAGTSVLLSKNGAETAAPLYFVSPNQINFQAPATGMGQIIIRRGDERSDITPVAVGDTGLGIFTLDGSGCGRAVVANVGADGSWSLNTPANSAAPGQPIIVLANGMGGYYLPPSGAPTPLSPLYPAFPDVALPPFGYLASSIKSLIAGNFVDVLFSGKAPGMIGVDQANILLPADVVNGCSVPLQLFLGGAYAYGEASQRVPVSIHPGGGPCVDPAPNTLADLTWVKTVSDGFDPAPPAEALRVTLVSGIGKRLDTPVRAGFGWCQTSAYVTHPIFQTARVCSGFDAYDGLPFTPGTLSLQPPGASIAFTPDGTSLSYNVPLPAGTIHEGAFTVASPGTGTVAPFTTTTHIPPPFELKTQFASGMIIKGPLSIDWTGGDANSIVRLQLVSHGLNYDSWMVDCAAPASAGHADFYAGTLGQYIGPVDLIISMSSEGDQLQTFSGPGLTQGRHGWSFEYRYKNVIPSSR